MTPEEFIKGCTLGCSNEMATVKQTDGSEITEHHEWVTPDQALVAVGMAREELIEEARQWILTHTFMFDTVIQIDLYIEQFVNAMKKGEKV